MAVFSPYECEEDQSLSALLTNKPEEHSFTSTSPLKPDSSSTEPQTHNQLSVGCSLVIMPYSLLLNAPLSHLLHSQHPLHLLICCSMPYRCTAAPQGRKASRGPNKCLSGTARATIAAQERELELTAASKLSTFALWKRVDPDRWCSCRGSPTAHSPFVCPLEPQKHSSQGPLL